MNNKNYSPETVNIQRHRVKLNISVINVEYVHGLKKYH